MKLSLHQKTISRIGFCKRCYEKGRPADGDFFTVIGSTSRKLHYHMFDAPLKRSEAPFLGYTPHFYVLEKIEGNKCTVLKACGMEGCCTFWKKDHGGGREDFEVFHVERIEMSLLTYNSLLNFTDSGMKI